MTADAAGAGAAEGPTTSSSSSGGRLDPDTWQCQLEELLALQSVYDEDFSLVAAPGVQPRGASSTNDDDGAHGGGEAATTPLDPEALLAAGPPPGLSDDGGGDSSVGGGASSGCFVAEALVHVDVPEPGLQLILELLPPPPQQQQPPSLPHEQEREHRGQPHQQGQLQGQAAGGPAAGLVGGGGGSSGQQGSQSTGPPGDSGDGGAGGGGCGSGGWDGDGDAGLEAVRSHGGPGRARRRGGEGGGGRGRGGRGACGPGGGPSGRGRSTSYGSPGSSSGRGGASEMLQDGSAGGGRGDRGGSYPRGDGARAAGERVGRGGRSGRGRGRGADARAGPLASEAHEVEVEVSGAPAMTGQSWKRVPAVQVDDAPRGPQAVRQADGGQPDRPVARPSSQHESPEGAVHPSSVSSLETAPRGQKGEEEATNASPSVNTTSNSEATPPPPAAAAPTLVAFGATVQFLSPIRVTLTFPPTYPATAPPAVTLHALWLSPDQAAALAAELMSQWAALGPGAPVVFTWLDWLRTNALEHLGVRQQLLVRTAAAADMVTAGAAPGEAAERAAAAGPEGVAVSLVWYSSRREQDKFNESNVSCSICLEQHLGSRCVRLPECRHAFCAPCLATHLRTLLGSGAVDNMRCPDPSCRRQLPPYVLQQLMSPEEYDRWGALSLQRTLDRMEDLVYCPRCREPCLEDKDHCTLCPKCFYSFCSLCEDAWHPGRTCLDLETRLALLEERRAAAEARAGPGAPGDRITAMERARQVLNRRNELKSLALLQSTTKQCPLCSMGVEKEGGCNKMTCCYCGAYFCWRCNKPIHGYDHFQQPVDGPPGGCVLFEQDEIDRWNARFYPGWQPAGRAAEVEQRRLVAGIMQQQGRRMRVCNCVVCGQRNVKEGGNNNIRCWSCNSHFCYLCRTWLRNRPGAHFTHGGCRQHTDD